MKKLKYFLISLIILFTIGTIDILSPSFSIFGISSKIFPDKYKNLVKEKLFFIPNAIKNERLLNKRVTILSSNVQNSKNNINNIYSLLKSSNLDLQTTFISEKKIISKNGNHYNLTLYSLPFLNYINSDAKVLPGKATSRMSAQSIAHLLMVVFIVFGNISYYLIRKRKI